MQPKFLTNFVYHHIITIDQQYSMRNFLQQAHWLSLDVMLGAIICNMVFWQLPNGSGNSEMIASIVLGVAVFVIYSADRLFDLRNVAISNTQRHAFHDKHKKVLWEIIIILSIFSTIFAFTLPIKILSIGLFLAVLVLLYLLAVNKLPKNDFLQIAKEPLTAIIYTIGIVGTAFVTKEKISWQEWAVALIFFAIVFQNLLLFSVYESIAIPSAKNLANFFGKKTSLTITTILFLIIVLFGSYTFSQNDHVYLARVLLVEMVMSAILWFLNDFVKFFIQYERYRWLGDGVFLLMIILLL
jgi:hypothetical protein